MLQNKGKNVQKILFGSGKKCKLIANFGKYLGLNLHRNIFTMNFERGSKRLC